MNITKWKKDKKTGRLVKTEHKATKQEKVDHSALIQDAQKQERIAEIKAELSRIDVETMRPMRAIQTDTATQDDRDRLAYLETQAQALRDELKGLSE